MVLQYIQQPNALILAVSPANSDLATSDALQIAKDVDPDRLRTIGVLTKLDLMDEGTDAREILENKKMHLARGFIGVLNRSQRDIDEGKDLNYSFNKEKLFFQSMPCYRHLADRMGSSSLQKMLHFQLRKHIKDSLPSVRQELAQKLSGFQKELKELETLSGYNNNGTNGVQHYMIKLIQNFISEFNVDLLGFSPKVRMSQICSGTLINYKIFTDVQKNLKVPEVPDQKELMRVIICMHGIRNCWSMPSLALDAVACELLAQYIEPLNKCVDSLAQIFHLCAEKTSKSLNEYPNLKNEVLYLIRKSIDESVLETKESLLKHIEAERYFPNIHHPDFVFPESNSSKTIHPVKLWCSNSSAAAVDDGNAVSSSAASGCSDSVNQAESIVAETENIMNALASDQNEKDCADFLSGMVKNYMAIQHKQISDIAIKYIACFLVNGVLEYIKSGLISTILGSPNSEMLLDDVAKDLAKMEDLRVTCECLGDALMAVQNFQ